MKAYPLFSHDIVNVKFESYSRKKGISKTEKQLHVTTCLLLDENKNVISAGITFQSITDPYNRKVGNKLAKVRAVASAISRKNLMPIKRNSMINMEYFSFLKDANVLFKAIFNPDRNIFIKLFPLIEKKKFNEKESIEV